VIIEPHLLPTTPGHEEGQPEQRQKHPPAAAEPAAVEGLE
jgi:hypothetical protein